MFLEKPKAKKGTCKCARNNSKGLKLNSNLLKKSGKSSAKAWIPGKKLIGRSRWSLTLASAAQSASLRNQIVEWGLQDIYIYSIFTACVPCACLFFCLDSLYNPMFVEGVSCLIFIIFCCGPYLYSINDVQSNFFYFPTSHSILSLLIQDAYFSRCKHLVRLSRWSSGGSCVCFELSHGFS